jgi:VanZ family protein
VDPRAHAPRGFFLNVVPSILYVVAVFYGGSIAQDPTADMQLLPFDKIVHFFGFAGMQLTMVRAVRYELPRLRYAQQLVFACLISSGLGAALEVYQSMLPDRTPDVVDWLADTAGAITAAVGQWLLFGAGSDSKRDA